LTLPLIHLRLHHSISLAVFKYQYTNNELYIFKLYKNNYRLTIFPQHIFRLFTQTKFTINDLYAAPCKHSTFDDLTIVLFDQTYKAILIRLLSL